MLGEKEEPKLRIGDYEKRRKRGSKSQSGRRVAKGEDFEAGELSSREQRARKESEDTHRRDRAC